MIDAKYIVIHCSATREDVNYPVEQLEFDHKSRGFSDIGYHFYILKSGQIVPCRPFKKAGAHVKGSNYNSIGVCYEGGLDKYGNAKDTRTEAQKQALIATLLFIKRIYPYANARGHRDFSPDKNGDGIISPSEFIKQCPCFDVKEEYKF